MSPNPNGSHPAESDPMRKLQEFTRRVLAVPKKEIDAKLAKEKDAKKRRKSS